MDMDVEDLRKDIETSKGILENYRTYGQFVVDAINAFTRLDELIADPVFNRITERLPLYMDAIDKANSEKGEKTLYTINITDRIPKLMENAEAALEHGANALMINYLAVGFSAVRQVTDDPSINVPVLGHMDIAGALSYSPISGLSTQLVIGKLPRLSGIDIEVFPAPYGKAPLLKQRYIEMARAMNYPLQHIKPTMPMPSGGITPGHVPMVVEDLGLDIMIGTGGGIHAYPVEHHQCPQARGDNCTGAGQAHAVWYVRFVSDRKILLVQFDMVFAAIIVKLFHGCFQQPNTAVISVQLHVPREAADTGKSRMVLFAG